MNCIRIIVGRRVNEIVVLCSVSMPNPSVDCIGAWLNNHNTCPFCRNNITLKPGQSFTYLLIALLYMTLPASIRDTFPLSSENVTLKKNNTEKEKDNEIEDDKQGRGDKPLRSAPITAKTATTTNYTVMSVYHSSPPLRHYSDHSSSC
ncbi:hypothetical protein CR513_09561, partial [Mucuna pruriens]